MGLTCVAGLELARLADLPPNVLVESKRVAETLAELHAKQKEDSESSKIAVRRKALLRVILFLSLGFSWIYGRWYLSTLTLNLALVASNATHASPGPLCTPRSRAPRLYSPFPKRYCQGLFECSLKTSTTLVASDQARRTPTSDANPSAFPVPRDSQTECHCCI